MLATFVNIGQFDKKPSGTDCILDDWNIFAAFVKTLKVLLQKLLGIWEMLDEKNILSNVVTFEKSETFHVLLTNPLNNEPLKVFKQLVIYPELPSNKSDGINPVNFVFEKTSLIEVALTFFKKPLGIVPVKDPQYPKRPDILHPLLVPVLNIFSGKDVNWEPLNIDLASVRLGQLYIKLFGTFVILEFPNKFQAFVNSWLSLVNVNRTLSHEPSELVNLVP